MDFSSKLLFILCLHFRACYTYHTEVWRHFHKNQ